MSNSLEEIQKIYTNFIVSPDGETGELQLDEKGQWTLKAVKSENPDNWKVHDSVTGELFSMPSRGIPASFRMIAGEFICTYKDIAPKGEPETDPIDNLKEGGFQIESMEEPDLEEIKATEDEKVRLEREENERILAALEAGEIQKPETKQMNRVNRTVNREKPVQRMPAIIPENMREIQIKELTINDIIQYICPSATDQEAFMFLKLCQARNLNPFLNEAYLIKYGDKTTMTVGKEAFMRRAEAHPQFDGYEAGIIIQNPDHTLERREGTFILKNEILVGGWAKIYRKDRKQPFVSEVALHEYNTGKALWISKPATMIRKVAIVQGKREAFPSEFGGMYDAAEMGGEVIDAVYEVGA